MNPRPVVLREAARQDVDNAVAHYLGSGGPDVALGFIRAYEAAARHISRFPRSGSSRHGIELNLPGLRSWAIGSHPYIVFYMQARAHIDVWRVLHGRRDIPEWIGASEPR